MTARTHPTPGLTDSQIKDIFVDLDMQFNRVMFTALLYGIYTGVVTVTLWAIASRNNPQNSKSPRFLVIIILLLYLLGAFGLYNEWAGELLFCISAPCLAVEFSFSPIPVELAMGITAILSVVLADTTLAWNLMSVFV
ncbi:hypothetical protein ARMSODRAFT_1089189 [Armillaria solidipes]|uniref:Uncharacterized protein n=1 Tax=Armillaria solidipes TaxID=1076256 RepID=A0A2H3BHD8_9AGAR|nr:hypothetical protein ARMSODRAFT_1089189 [Armillaria solidipes]